MGNGPGTGVDGVGVYGSNPNLASNGQKIDLTSKFCLIIAFFTFIVLLKF